MLVLELKKHKSITLNTSDGPIVLRIRDYERCETVVLAIDLPDSVIVVRSDARRKV